MKTTIREFLMSTLTAARYADECLWGRLKQEEATWEQWCFDDQGAHWIPYENRERTINQDHNLFALICVYEPERVVLQ